ncbi:hypothetical protein [Aeromicrobium fastidiosum]|uniref:Uncharacterized protein n=1 Tax=Aeromicrobium fastidiosum TaxID=52699 RepID=A0A641ANG7_9ACTN|nr:hypothetical protein [Aeromicrobium fastidiosum]KAA1376342.1 hypothetical protein ESP62_012980 [Aeromicrobium fastidiosum]MBP2391758.1 hypothetical protein [Aeromicrobium fastidiosum]
MRKTKIDRRLLKSMEDGRIATIVRDAFELTFTDGFVLALTDDWVVLHSLDGVYLDGIVMLRLRDISRVLFRDDDAYHHRAIAALGETVTEFTCDDDVSVSDLLVLASARDGIFTFYCEVLEDEPLIIGRLIELRKKSFDIHYVGRDGEWAPEIERWKYRDVTRIEVGGRYLDALNRFADPYSGGGTEPSDDLQTADA